MIELQSLTKSYSTRNGVVTALDHLTLEIPTAGFFAVRGHSGSGKSTLLSLIGGLTTPTSGSVLIDEFDMGSASPAARAAFRAESIGFVFQMFHLLPYLTIVDNVVAAASPGVAQVRDRATELLERFGLADRLGHRPGQLSAGERQRAAVARALINSPKLLLADEPTGNLDAKNAEAVLDLLAQFNEDGGTVLLVTHDERAAERASESVLLDGGRLLDESQAS